MTPKLRIVVALASLCIPLAACSKSKRAESEQIEQKKQRDGPRASTNNQSRETIRERNTGPRNSSKPQDDTRFQDELLENLVVSWDQVATEFKGEELLHKQWEIEKRVAALGPSDALLRFFDFLASKGDNDIRERVISEISNAIFSGPDAERSRQWLLTLQDKVLQEKLCRYAGKYHPKEGIKEYIDAFHPDAKCQSAVLTSYCKNLTKTDPSGAVKAFTELIPPNVTFAGLVDVMTLLPPESDFATISATLPGDTKNIAKRARAAMIQSWTVARPEEAAQYVIANTTLVSPDQMGVVVKAWTKSAPDDAAHFIDSLSSNPIKDEGSVALAKYWTAKAPAKAWDFAGKVGDSSKRMAAATEVFKEWEKTDRDSATKAWAALFPEAEFPKAE